MDSNGGSRQEAGEKPAKYQVPAVVGAISVLHEVATSDEPGVTQAELVKSTGLSKSTMHNLLATLEAHDFVRRENNSRNYRLGPALIPLGTEASRQVRLVRSTIDRVAPLAAEYHLSFAVAQVVSDEECRIIERFYPTEDVHVGILIGSSYGPMDGALGKVLDSLYSTAERDKFRTRVESGAAGETEIYISHRGMYEIYTNEGKSETRWQPRPADPDLEAEMLRRLMVRFGMDEARAKTLFTDTGAKVEKAKLVTAKGGVGTLEVQDAFDRAWRRVGLALDRVGFTVEDRDRSQGLYFVRYVDPEIDARKKDKDEGFLAKLAFWRSKPDPAKSQRYRVLVKGAGETSYLQVLTSDGAPEASETGAKILRLLLDQLK